MQRRHLLAAAGASLSGLSGCAGPDWTQTQSPAPAMSTGLYSAADLAHAALLRDRALADPRALALVRGLTQDVGARPAGSPGDAKAVAWALAQCRALGLQAVRAEPLPLRIWQRGPASAEIVAPERHTLVMTALGNSVGTPAGGLDAQIAYYPSFAALKADASDQARGRIAFVDERTDRTRDGAGYSRAAPARFGSAAEAARRGALAVVIRSIGTSSATGADRVAHTGAMRYDDTLAAIPALAVSVPDADLIARLQAGGAVRLRLQLANQIGVDATTHNVIAELPGTDLADEVVLISAHLDSWDVGEGAVDDGAGVAVVCAAAGLIRAAGRAPRRTIRVVLFGNEENGFDGALAYGNRYKAQRHQLVAESDFGAGAIYALRSRVDAASQPAFEAMAQMLAPLGVPLTGNNANPGPDAAVLMRRHQWPAVSLSQDGSAYFDLHHTAHDTFARMDASALPQNVACWAVVAWLAAQAPMGFMAPSA